MMRSPVRTTLDTLLEEKKQCKADDVLRYHINSLDTNEKMLIKSFTEKIIKNLDAKEKQHTDKLAYYEEVINMLPDSRGKTALILHYLIGIPMKCIVVDLDISTRQLQRDINKALDQLETIMKQEKVQ